MEILNLENLRIQVERRKKHRRLFLSIHPDGGIRITAPKEMSAEHIRDFILSNQEWIRRELENSTLQSGVSGNALEPTVQMVWGIPHQLKLIERPGNPRITLTQRIMNFYARPGTTALKRREFLSAWYLRILKEIAPPLADRWAARIGVTIREINFREMKTIWGSCNPGKGTIRLNTKLVKYAPQCLEYVIVHELIHLLEPRHNANFYRLMNRHLPGWEKIRRRLNKEEL